jgi:hypothetical protein
VEEVRTKLSESMGFEGRVQCRTVRQQAIIMSVEYSGISFLGF